ncbi:bifunctional 4-hydroxy-2-oxoglutarate aldolase/2-dehydro-3-deoxy-phosphogluconate aldolase [Amphritea pacifica]|uniref:bifunctional 4-hydroxy-2-oxoglutarate aldolase/2-dehydro-3-deoxy-phosphogluconate aldolase n=1 Tax=Amphritea pacifica TaxID=2811233 RepID=UPI0019638FF0|nr:bifunctional 4-hydroxy-2-oxoglutarate aldolase/2-dehydro-3-deoxy-phosphogluconate aldolase [Amphritea pacifica]MBN1005182.1 bifunctional 4-hydroxy-2-oxoglutarate aldolase/2-dehydro-3-deoxy-phosphogluconate aldolase [Amphritea pacifica]
MTKKTLSAEIIAKVDQLCSLGPVIPVLTIENVADAVPLAEALVEGGLPVLEVTLRTGNALKVIEAIAHSVPQAKVGAGTVINPESFQRCVDSGSSFIVSPGITNELLDYGVNSDAIYLPGIQTVSEMMEGIKRGYKRFKFFPAEISGGTAALKAFGGPFADIRFCPTGGIRVHTAADYLALPNVMCVGGTWLTPDELIANKDWAGVMRLAQEAVSSATKSGI